ncbi:unnamed protein product [Oikopleura dioica]|uniref:Uncharacterized protein n=1 Tax=Oikopleura dioica TaxID=34765 RepID=E4Y960_OIKDI|nr:unnamed protein product [Oikopleura dioica]
MKFSASFTGRRNRIDARKYPKEPQISRLCRLIVLKCAPFWAASLKEGQRLFPSSVNVKKSRANIVMKYSACNTGIPMIILAKLTKSFSTKKELKKELSRKKQRRKLKKQKSLFLQ